MKNQPHQELRSDRKDSYYNFPLREARLIKGYTLGQMAEEVGVSLPAYNTYERLRALPNPLVARRICRILGKKPSELFPQQLREIIREIRSERGGDESQRYFENLEQKINDGTATQAEQRRHEALQRLRNPISLNDVPEEQLISSIGISPERAPDAAASEDMLRERIEAVLKTLTYREREIIKLRYGIGDGYTYTIEDVGRIFKVTRERVRQVEAKAIRKLMHPVRARKLEGFLSPSQS